MRNSKSNLNETIASHALTMFKTQGIKAVRMDDVAKSLKISKRTLYEQFTDKEQLLLECVKLNARNKQQIYESYMEKAEGLMEIMCFFIKHGLEEFSRYSPDFFMDVLKYKSVRDYLDQKQESDRSLQEEFLKQAIEEGLIVSNVNFKLLSRMNKAALDNLIRDKVYEQYPLQEIFRNFILVFLRGILTAKGQEELEQQLGDEFFK